MKEPTLYVIDGSSYIFRAYHAIRSLNTSKGFPTNAVYGFTNMIFRFLKDFEPEHLGIVFDSKGETFRNDIYPLYKANRDEPPDELKLQFPKIFEVVDALGLPRFQIEGYEADDVIGTIANNSETLGINVVVITGDKDFYQLVSDRVSLIDTMRNRKTGVKDVIDKFGVPPGKVTDIFALSGDSIDNIPGVRGIGEKTAKELIGKFGSLNGLFENVDKISKRQKRLIEENKENALLSKRLVTIKTDVPIKFRLDDCRYEGFDREKLVKIFEELEFKSLIRELANNGSAELGNTFEEISKSEVSYDNYKLVLSEADLDRLIKRVKKSGEVSIDLETTSHEPMRAKIVGISFSPIPHEAYYIPIAHKSSIESRKQLNIDYVFDGIKEVIEDGKIKKIGQNLKYEYIVFERQGIRLKGIFFDTMIAAHLLDSSKRSYSLDELAKIYLGHKTITYKDLTGTGKGKIDFEEVDLDRAKVYACEDADVAMILGKKLMPKLKELNLVKVFEDVHLKLLEVIARMEISGVKVDSSRLYELSLEFARGLDELAKEIYSQVGYKFNLNSPLQLREVLFVNLKLPKKKLTKKGEPSTDVEVLSDLSRLHPVPEKILEFRGLSKLKSTYVDALPKIINAETGRIHTSINQVGTSTGRVSSSDPNLQNIPIKTEEGKRIREAFIPERGFLLLSADYSQIELRLLAHFSGDESLLKAFLAGSDIHNRTASEIFGVSEDMVSPEMRRLSKNINFGIIYGISAFGLAKQLGTSVSVAKNYMDEYFKRYRKVKQFMEESIKKAQNKGYATTILGRRRLIPELSSNDRTTRGFGERTAINTPIQGSAADIMEIAMIRIHDILKDVFKTRMILQVHDELLFEVHIDELDQVSKIVRKEMEGAWKLNVPLRVDVGVGNNWAEAH
ncbi:DNA polymerase I [Desulfobacterota bacterium AH_259_B03_O07]|nr:DNA polymerase I [Desulfobacterota bacterium AH_259_B03_O07]